MTKINSQKILLIGMIIAFASILSMISFDSANAQDETVVGSTAPITWNIGEIQWLKQSHSPNGSVVVRVTDPDLNQNPNEVDKFKIDVWSDSDPDGISPSVYETGENTGIFESKIYFSVKSSAGQRLHTIEGDIAIAKYKDHTLPSPYTSDDELGILDSIIIRKTFANPDENQNPFIRIEDDSFTRQSLQTGKTLGDANNTLGWLGLMISLFIVFAYVIMKIKKKRK